MRRSIWKRSVSALLAVVLCLSMGVTAGAKSFVDVDDDAWYSTYVYEAVDAGLFTGIDDTHFAPDESVTRGMLVTVLWRMCGAPSGYVSAFADVQMGAYYADAVAWANVTGIVTGVDTQTFAPNTSVTREQMALILMRFAEFRGYGILVGGNISDYPDAEEVSDYALQAVRWIVSNRIMRCSGNFIRPVEAATRAEVAACLISFLAWVDEYNAEEEEVDKDQILEELRGKDGLNGHDGMSAYEVACYNGYRGTVQQWLESLVGAPGKDGVDGKSVYEIAVTNGYTGTEVEWLRTLAGENGKSAYELAVDNGYVGTEVEWLASLVGETGPVGADGKSAYELAVEAGYTGTQEQWLASLIGPTGAKGADGVNGKSAYELAVENGYTGDIASWLDSLVGKDGVDGKNGKSAYDLAVENGFTGTVAQWLASLAGADGADGKSAYELAMENGYQGTLQQWLDSLVGKDGRDGAEGKSAYDIAVNNGYQGTEQQWLDSLSGKQGEDGKSAYALAVENGFEGTVVQWLESLKGAPGKDGMDGKDGADGVGVATAYINGEKHLILELTDGTIIDAGFVGVEVEPVTQVVVTFVDYDGTVLKTQYVEKGASAEPPADPVRQGSTFTGWRGNYVNVYVDTIVVAQYECLWVTEDEVPEGAETVKEKWTYDLTTYLESSNDYEEGYTLYDTTSEWSEYGSWSGWDTEKVTASDSRQVEIDHKDPVYKTQYWYSAWTNTTSYPVVNYHSGPVRGTWDGVYCSYFHERGWSDEKLEVFASENSNQAGFFYKYGGGRYPDGTPRGAWYNEQTREVLVSEGYTKYRYRDRELIYTYFHFKTESLESETEIFPGKGISNIQKWVQYIP